MKFRLVESDIEDIIYVDDETGKHYLYKNGKYIEIKKNKNNSKNSSKTSSSNNKNSNRSSSSNSKDDKEPQIGDTGDKETQDKEQAERDANDVTKRSQEEEDARLERIRRLLGDKNIASDINDETSKAVRADSDARIDRENTRYMNSSIARFEKSLNNFIRNQLVRERSSTWSKFNKTYVNSNIIKPGIRRQETGNIPCINVYFDQSQSWKESDIRVGEQAIGTLNNYVRRGEIKINIYYFSEDVHTTAQEARAEGGTKGQPILDNIKETKPDNVIVMTDDDIDDCKSNVQVPGAVWFLWRKRISNNLKSHLSGKTETEEFMLE